MTSVPIHSLTGNAAVLKRINAVRLLHRLWHGKTGSRVQLSRDTGLDAKTITNLINPLIAADLVRETQTKASGRGRPAHVLGLNPDARYSIGLDIGARQVTGILLNFAGNVTASRQHTFRTPPDRAGVLAATGKIATALIATLPPAKRERLEGIGVGVPGFIDRRSGVVIAASNLADFREVPLLALLEKQLRQPVFLEEASRAMALAEIWFGAGGSYPDFICLDLGYGIGMGIVQDGLLYYGAHGFTGEIGHTVVEPGGVRCECGKNGCLETVASGKALETLAANMGCGVRKAGPTGGEALHAAAVTGNLQAKELLARAGRSIGIAAANAVSLFDPGAVILNGGLVQAGPFLVEPLLAAFGKHTLPPYTQNCPVLVSRLGQTAGAQGAAMLPLRHHFEFENLRLRRMENT